MPPTSISTSHRRRRRRHQYRQATLVSGSLLVLLAILLTPPPQLPLPVAVNTNQWAVDARSLMESNADNQNTQNVQAATAMETTGGDNTCLAWPPSGRQVQEGNMELERWLFRLKCVMKPLLGSFTRMLQALQVSQPDLFQRMMTLVSPEVMSELNHQENIDKFYDAAIYVLNRRDFCTFSTILKLKEARDLAAHSALITSLYDFIAIEFHSGCLREAVGHLPPVPYVIKEVVQIYLSGVDQEVSLPDLNGDPFAAMEDIRLERMQEQGDKPFDVQSAIAKNGKLEQVVRLLLFMPAKEKSSGNLVQDFKDSCRNFLIEIEQRWLAMELMSTLLASEGNQIHAFNNYIMRSLMPTKYADACSQLSAVS